MKCKGNCKKCKYANIKVSLSENENYIPYCLECIKYGIYADSLLELFENVQYELFNEDSIMIIES